MAKADKDQGWNIGVDDVDAEHARLLALVEEAEQACAVGDMSRAARRLIAFLDLFKVHFDDETRRLEALELPDIARRRAEFLTSLSLVSVHTVDGDDPERVTRACDLMRTWLVDHIVRQDMPLRDFFAARGSAQRPRRRPWARFDVIGLRWRLALLGVVLVAIVIGLASVAFGELAGTLRTTGILRDMNLLNAEIGGVVHELQAERALSVMIVSNPRLDRSRLKTQIGASDAALERYRTSVARLMTQLPEGPTREALESARSSLGLIPEVRGDVQDGSYDAIQTTEYYNTAIDDLMAVVPEVVRTAMRSDLGKDTIAYVFLLEAKERAGRERSLGAGILAGSIPDMLAGRSENIRTLATQEDSLGQAFEALVPANVAEGYRAAAAVSPALAKMRLALENRDTLGITARDWFDVTSERIDRIRTFEQQIVLDMEVDVNGIESQAWLHASYIGWGIVIAIVGSVSILTLLGWSIVPPLRRLANNVRRLAEGERLLALPDASGRDEIGELTRSLTLLRDRLIQGDLLEARRGNENAERLRAVTDSLPGIVFRVAQSDGKAPRVIAVSHKMQRLTGLRAADVIDRPLRGLLYRLVDPTDRPALLHLLHRIGGSAVDFEFRLRESPADRPRWFRILASPSRTGDGRVWDGVALEVTAIKQSEAEHARLGAELERLRRTQLADRLGTSFGGEFDALWPSIVEHARAALGELPPTSPARAHLDAILGVTREMNDLCERIRLSARDGRHVDQPVDIVAALERHIDRLTAILPSTMIVTAFEDRDIRVAADPAEIDRLVANLAVHLRSMMGGDGGTLTVATHLASDGNGDPAHVRIAIHGDRRPSVRRDDDRAGPSLAVSRGAQVEELALTIVRTIADGFGGWVQIDRSGADGSNLEIFLPLHRARADNIINLEEVTRWRTRAN